MKASTIWDKRWVRRIVATVFWLAVWEFVSFLLPNMLFAGPVQTAQSLLLMLGDGNFWKSILLSLGKVAMGFILAAVLGCLCATMCHRFVYLQLLLEPAVQIMKSVPVACFIVVALIWVRSAWISVLTAFFVVFPLFHINLVEGLTRLDVKMLEMASMFRLHGGKRFQAIYLPGTAPYLLSACRVAVGMALKAGIAGEIIGLPAHSIGEQLYLSKLYLNTADLFAWTTVIILLSLVLEKLLVRAVEAMQHTWEASE